MPLSEDSRALLQLLLGRGKSYADISSLLGINEGEVRDRAVKALTEIDDTGHPPDAELTDYLLGKADAITRAEVSGRISSSPEVADQARSLTEQLRLLVPGADLPEPGSVHGGKPKPAPKPAASEGPAPKEQDSEKPGSSTSSLSSITSHQRRLIAILLGAALLAAVVILLLTGVIGGDGSDQEEDEKPAANNTVAVLSPVNGQQGSGQVQFGFVGTDFAANLNIRDLKPNRGKQGYVIWLNGSSGAFPIFSDKVGDSGSIVGQIPLNVAVVCLIASDIFPELRVSRTNDKDLNAALKQSRVDDPDDVKLPEFTGELVLDGQISMPQTAKDLIVPICSNGTADQGS